MSQYVLGTTEHELARLALQQEVWGGFTERFLDRLRLPRNARVLDLGCGPGFVLDSLRSRLGHEGHITALDESPAWMKHLSKKVGEHGWTNVHLVQKRIQDFELPAVSLDLVFARWVLSFLPEPQAIVERLARALKPGGVLAVQDYNHEGVSLFPESDGFRAIVRATRALYASQGGDTWIAARLPGLLRKAGLELVEFAPHVLCGGPSSPVFRWAGAFFPHHSEGMVQAGVLTQAERALFLREWEERKANPDALFFSPMVVDVAGRKRVRSR